MAPTIFLTGATDGLGRALARHLAGSGCRLILHGRDPEKGAALLDELGRRHPDARLEFECADFSSLDQIQELADRVLTRPALDVLVNNAGMGVEHERRSSDDGLELTFQVDYLATYVLGCRLAPLLARSDAARVVNVSSAGQSPIDFDDVLLERSWDGVQAYCQAKLAQIMTTFDLAETLEGTGVTVNALHPASYMPTKIVTHMFTPQSTVDEGMRNTLRLVTDPELDGVTGRYFNRSRPANAHAQAYDLQARRRLREVSEKLTGTSLPIR